MQGRWSALACRCRRFPALRARHSPKAESSAAQRTYSVAGPSLQASAQRLRQSQSQRERLTRRVPNRLVRDEAVSPCVVGGSVAANLGRGAVDVVNAALVLLVGRTDRVLGFSRGPIGRTGDWIGWNLFQIAGLHQVFERLWGLLLVEGVLRDQGA